jgi:hypothetical protein
VYPLSLRIALTLFLRCIDPPFKVISYMRPDALRVRIYANALSSWQYSPVNYSKLESEGPWQAGNSRSVSSSAITLFAFRTGSVEYYRSVRICCFGQNFADELLQRFSGLGGARFKARYYGVVNVWDKKFVHSALPLLQP